MMPDWKWVACDAMILILSPLVGFAFVAGFISGALTFGFNAGIDAADLVLEREVSRRLRERAARHG